MRVNKLTFTTGEIDAVNGTVKTAYIDVSASGGVIGGVQQVDVIRKYPISMSVVNTTGSSLDIAVLANAKEVADFAVNPNNYFFLLPKNASIGFTTGIGRAHSIAVKKVAGRPTSSLRVDLGNLVGTVKIN